MERRAIVEGVIVTLGGTVRRRYKTVRQINPGIDVPRALLDIRLH